MPKSSSVCQLYLTSAAFILLLCESSICYSELKNNIDPGPMEEINIIGRQAGPADNTGHAWSEYIDASAAVGAPSNIAQVLQENPGIGVSGQGGLFQTISIRGLSKQRISNFYLDIPIVSDRRAGTSSSFIDPLMLDEIELLRGPASTYYGSGALGGVIQMSPRKIREVELDVGWGSNGAERFAYLGWGAEYASFSLSQRTANDTSSGDSTPLHTGFEQTNAHLKLVAQIDELQLMFNTLVSIGKDIGKSNTLFPEQRITEYPRERHWLGQLSADLEGLWHASVFFHYQDLLTLVDGLDEPISEVRSESADFGGSSFLKLGLADLPLRLGFDYLARRDVIANETTVQRDGLVIGNQVNLDAVLDQFGMFIDTREVWGAVLFEAGIRWSYVAQRQASSSRTSDSAWSGFVRGSWQATPRSTLSLEVASGIRFPNVSEQYFSGTTGRGTITGNVELNPEQTLATELAWLSELENTKVDLRVYYMDIDEFVTRIELAQGSFTNINIGGGHIVGAEYRVSQIVNDRFSLFFGGQYLEGEDDNMEPLSDIAPSSLTAGARYKTGQWTTQINYEHRFKKTDVAQSERQIGHAQRLSLEISHTWANGQKFSVWSRNVLNDTYVTSTDKLSAHAAQRAFGVRFSWRGG